jgi:hypothetical protein
MKAYGGSGDEGTKCDIVFVGGRENVPSSSTGPEFTYVTGYSWIFQANTGTVP